MKNIITKLFVFTLLVAVTISMVSCNKNKNDNEGGGTVIDPPKDVAKIDFTMEKDSIAEGETVKLTVKITDSTETGYTWSLSNDNYISIENDTITFVESPKVDKSINITVTLNNNSTVTATKSISVKATVKDGQVGDLTSEMIQAIGGANITFTGVLTDVYQDFNQTYNSTTHKYDMVVKMDTGRYYGAWNTQGDTENVVVTNYRQGETNGLKDQQGNVGHALEQLYINKNNEVAYAQIKDYMSIPAIWEAQHLWNHVGNLQIEKFKYDETNDVYEYQIDQKDEDDLYLMTYLSYCLTPVLSDTLLKFYVKVEGGKITKIFGQTEVLYYGSDTQEDADAMSYSTIEITCSDAGTTVVPNPEAYDAPENVDKLQSALDKMKAATNYTYQANDTTTYAPTGDDEDYSLDSISNNTVLAKLAKNKARDLSVVANDKLRNNVSSTGVAGEHGWITEEAIIFAKTGEYSYYMDDGKYHTEYSGYKQNNDGTYDEFEYQYNSDAFVGKRKITGSMSEVLPTFEFSPNLFEFTGTQGTGSKKKYIFKLKETAITRDLAMEVSMYTYADDAAAASDNTFTIVVDENGNLVSTTYPYALVSTYYGYVTTTYSEIGTTVIPEGAFDDYVPRVIPTSWNEYEIKYYHPGYSTLNQPAAGTTTAQILEWIYGDDVVDLPDPMTMVGVFSDIIYGPFYDWKQKSSDQQGNPIYTDWISINTQSTKYDENYMVTNYDEIIAKLTESLGKLGFTISAANTDTSGGTSGRSDRYVTFIKNNIQIVIWNNWTKNFSIYFYKTGDWTLKR